MYTTIISIASIVMVAALCWLSYTIGRFMECYEWMYTSASKDKIIKKVYGDFTRYFKVEEIYKG